MTTTYFRFEIDGEQQGLVRRRESNDFGSVFARVGDGGWVNDQDLFRYLVDPSDVTLAEVPTDEAKAVAESLGVTLEAEPVA